MNENFIDYYRILGVNPTANKKEIKKAYYRKANEYHPDKHINENLTPEELQELETKFKEVAEAYEVLSNEKSRRKYDMEYKAFYERKERRKAEQESRRTSQNNYTDNYSRTNQERYSSRSSRTYRSGEKKKKSFMDDLKQSIDEVKRQERRSTFTVRHREWNKDYYKEFAPNVDSISKEIVFRIGQGTVHVLGETIFQLRKLRYINRDSVPQYIYRNRVTATALVISLILAGNGFAMHKNNHIQEEPVVIASEQEVPENANDEFSATESIILTRHYTVQAGDTLSGISNDSNTPMSTIQNINEFSTSNIYIGDVLTVPYEIDMENLQYYTEVIETQGKSIYDLANEYETDVETLVRLNKEAVSKVNDSYIILSDTIIVPNFITRTELNNIKGTNKTY